MDNFDFDKVKKRTNVDKDTIIDLAKMVNENGLKDEKTLRTVINKLSLTIESCRTDTLERIFCESGYRRHLNIDWNFDGIHTGAFDKKIQTSIGRAD